MNATVAPGSFLTLHYRLAGPDGGAVIDTFADKPATLSLGTGELAPAMEARLIGLTEGARQSFSLEAGEAFGARNPELLQRVKRCWPNSAMPMRATTLATWSSSRHPTGRARTPAWCARSATTGCCSTSTIRWRASRCASTCT
jgi:hypothetical protein